jgi:phospholipid/cholesterol/gamma-HCH transport system substrate-binding protein
VLRDRFKHWYWDPPRRTANVVMYVIIAIIAVLVFLQFRGDFTPKTTLTMLASRSGLSMDPGSKVTYNGVEIGRVSKVATVDQGGTTKAKLSLDVDPKYIHLIPANVDADIKATTVFGNKYVAFRAPKNPTPQRISSNDVIDVSGVTTEFNTLFETIVSVAEKVDPVKLNATLTAAAQALDGLGDRFGQSISHGNEILADLNPRQAQLRYDIQKLADLAGVYADASPDLWDALRNAVTTARTFNDQQSNLDATLMASIGFGNTGGDVLERGAPYFVRGTEDLLTTTGILDEYSPMLFCLIHKEAMVAPKVAASVGGNGYSIRLHDGILGAGNPWVYPDNLPRVNAQGGPEGRPGCWQEVTRDLWPAPYLVTDIGASIAPYNHFGLSSPFSCSLLCLTPVPVFFPGIEYVWGRQLGEWTINP